MEDPSQALVLLEVVYAAFKDRLIFVTGNVEIETVAGTLGVSHFAENTAVGACDTLDGEHRAVGVAGEIHGGNSLKVNVLGCDLAVSFQISNNLLVSYEAAFSVADGNGVNVSYIALGEPGA